MALVLGVGVVAAAGGDEAGARGAIEGVVAGVADLREAEDELAQALGRVAKRVGVYVRTPVTNTALRHSSCVLR